jgi:hypothetical protein
MAADLPLGSFFISGFSCVFLLLHVLVMFLISPLFFLNQVLKLAYTGPVKQNRMGCG